jgi:cob(I)alamin adenosyltransferase
MTDRIYTRTGDTGETGLFGGGRVAKSHPRVEAYGEVDELNAQIGVARTQVTDVWLSERLGEVQPDLFTVGAHLATAPAEGSRSQPGLPELPPDRAAEIEAWIDTAESRLPPLRAFILPGGSKGGAALHVCRTVCRRAERRIVSLAAAEPVDNAILVLLNRLSDFLFVAARLENATADVPDVKWDPSGRSERLESKGRGPVGDG